MPASPSSSPITRERTGQGTLSSTTAVSNATAKSPHSPTIAHSKLPNKAKQLVMVKVSPCDKLLQTLGRGRPANDPVSDTTVSYDDSELSKQRVRPESQLRSPNTVRRPRAFPLSLSNSESEDSDENSTCKPSSRVLRSTRDAHLCLKVDTLRSKVEDAMKAEYKRHGSSQSSDEEAETAFAMSEDGSSDARSLRRKSRAMKKVYSEIGSCSAAELFMPLELDSEDARALYDLKKRPKLKLTKTWHSSRWLKSDKGTENLRVNGPSSDTNNGVGNTNVECSIPDKVSGTLSSDGQTMKKKLQTKASPYFDSDIYTSDDNDSGDSHKPWQKFNHELTLTKDDGHLLKNDTELEQPTTKPSLPSDSHMSDYGDNQPNVKVRSGVSSQRSDTMSNKEIDSEREVVTASVSAQLGSDASGGGCSDGTHVPYMFGPEPKQDPLTVKDKAYPLESCTKEEEPSANTSLPLDSENMNDSCDNTTSREMQSSTTSTVLDMVSKNSKPEPHVCTSNNATQSVVESTVSSVRPRITSAQRPSTKESSMCLRGKSRAMKKKGVCKVDTHSGQSKSRSKTQRKTKNGRAQSNSLLGSSLFYVANTGEVLGLRRSLRVLYSMGNLSLERMKCKSPTKKGECGEPESSKHLFNRTGKQRAPIEHGISSRSPLKRPEKGGSKSSDRPLRFEQLRRSKPVIHLGSRDGSQLSKNPTRKRHQEQPSQKAMKEHSNPTSTATQAQQMNAQPSDESQVPPTTTLTFELADVGLSESLSDDFKTSRKRLRFNTSDSERYSNNTADLKKTLKKVRFSEPSDSDLSELDDLLMNIASRSLATPQKSQEGEMSSSVRNLEKKAVNSSAEGSSANDCLQLGRELTVCSDNSCSTLQTKLRRKSRRIDKDVALSPSTQLSKTTSLEVYLPTPELLPDSPHIVESQESVTSRSEQTTSGIHTVLSHVSKICESVGQTHKVKTVQPKRSKHLGKRMKWTQRKRHGQTTKNVGSLERRDSADQLQVNQKRNRSAQGKRGSKNRAEPATAPPVKRSKGNPSTIKDSPSHTASAASEPLMAYTIPKISKKGLNKVKRVIASARKEEKNKNCVSTTRQKAPPVDTQSPVTKKGTSSANLHGKSRQQGSKGRMQPSFPHGHKVKHKGERSSNTKQVKTLRRPNISGDCSSLKGNDCITSCSHRESNQPRSNFQLVGSIQASVTDNKNTTQLEKESRIPNGSVGNSASDSFGSTVRTEVTAHNSSSQSDEIDVVNFTPEYNDPSPDDDPVYTSLLLHSEHAESPSHMYTSSGIYLNDETDSSPKPYLSPEIGIMKWPCPPQYVNKSHYNASSGITQPFCLSPNSLQQRFGETDRYFIINDEYEQSQLLSQYSHAPVQRVARQMYSSDNESIVSGSSMGTGVSVKTVKLEKLNR